MRPSARAWSPLRALSLVVVCALVLGGVWLWLAHDDGGAEVVGDSQQGWKTIRYQGATVDIPASWERSDRDDCEFDFEVWTPPGSRSCRWTAGVAFYASATFDPGQEPGVNRTERPTEPEWAGYTYAGEYAVYAADDDRETVQRVLDSAE